MNKKDLRELPWRNYGKVKCINCGMMKWTCTIVGNYPGTSMLTHVSNIAHCCDSPTYTWTDVWRHNL